MSVTVLQGDCRDVLKTLDAESVQCVVTSPPYFGLRDYGTVSWDGGDSDCDHEQARSRTGFDYALSGKQQSNAGSDVKAYANSCPCGAERFDRQIGLEQTPREYVAQLVGVFREIRRVLRKDGVAWLNLGDSYSSGGRGSYDPAIISASSGLSNHSGSVGRNRPAMPQGIKPKDLLMIPARVAIALCDDGWYLRSEIVWAKPNPMPESVTDRPTRSHEMIYLLSKSQTYFYDQDAILEPLVGPVHAPGNKTAENWREIRGTQAIKGMSGHLAEPDREWGNAGGRNRRSVWTVPTHPYPEAHFATFPEALIEPCILAGSRVGDTVLDPFGGSGTTGKVATKHRRDAVLIELNPEYCKLIDRRTSRVQQTLPMEEAI